MQAVTCFICLGKGALCVGVTNKLMPILTLCYSCGGRGWNILSEEKHGGLGFLSHGRKDDDSGTPEMQILRIRI